MCKKSILKKSDNLIVVPNLNFIDGSLNLVELVKKLLKLYKFKITANKNLHLKKDYYYVKQTPSTIDGQKLYEKLHEKDEIIFFDKNKKYIYVNKKLTKSNKDLLLKNIISAKSINEIKKLIKKDYKNYIITKKNFNIKNSL